jgi:dTDP-4-amino-4,6-dideoxygalactose transaminase
MSKNLPCWGGGAVVVKDPGLAGRMTKIVKQSSAPANSAVIRRQLFNIISMLATHPAIFPWTLYPVLRAADYLQSDFFDRRFLEEVLPPRRTWKKVSSDRLAVSSEGPEENGPDTKQSGSTLRSDKQSAASGEQAAQVGPRAGMIAMSPLQAGTGLRQLRRFPELLERQVRNARRLRERLARSAGLKLQAEPEGSRSSFLYVRARVDDPSRIRQLLRRYGVDTKADDMRDCSALSIFPERPSCPGARYLGGHCIELPCGPYYSPGRIDDIASRVEKAVQ